MSWNDANTYCKNTFGTTLSTITSESDNIALQSIVGNTLSEHYSVLIGYNDINNEGTFTWVDGFTPSNIFTQ